VTAIVNTGDDAWVAGVRIAPDLDTIMYTLAGQNDTRRGWGRVGETERVSAELEAYGVGWPWFTLGDLDLGTHLARTSLLRDGLGLTEATRRIAGRWDLGIELLPATEDEFETQVELEDGRVIHFQEWWVRYRAELPARGFRQSRPSAAAAPGVLEAIAEADLVLIAPSNPVVSIGPILQVDGIRDAVRARRAPVIGVSPIIGGAVVRGMADACLRTIGVETSAEAVGLLHGARSGGGVLDGWLVDTVDAAAVPTLTAAGLRAAAVPLWMRDEALSLALAREAIALAG
jgi:LPPG:FO 2-phospho-L-lactate transferase